MAVTIEISIEERPNLNVYFDRLFFWFFNSLTAMLATVLLPQVQNSTPIQSGQLRQAFYIRRSPVRQGQISLTVEPSGWYWHLVRRGSVIQLHDILFRRAVERVAPLALQRAITRTNAEF